MAQAEFPPGVSMDIPPEKTLAEEVIDSLFEPMGAYLDALDKIQDHAAAGRKVDCVH